MFCTLLVPKEKGYIFLCGYSLSYYLIFYIFYFTVIWGVWDLFLFVVPFEQYIIALLVPVLSLSS